MIQLREPYTPPIHVRESRFRTVSVGAAAVADATPTVGFPRAVSAMVGAADFELSASDKLVGTLYLAPFVAGPPAVGYLVGGTIGAVVGAVWAAPAIYVIIAALMS